VDLVLDLWTWSWTCGLGLGLAVGLVFGRVFLLGAVFSVVVGGLDDGVVVVDSVVLVEGRVDAVVVVGSVVVVGEGVVVVVVVVCCCFFGKVFSRIFVVVPCFLVDGRVEPTGME
jgi:hypothetical protein